MSKPVVPDKETLHVEYAATNDAYLHYDAFSWQVGSVLIAGAFVFWGLAISADTTSVRSLPMSVGAFLVTLLMSVWLFYTHHCRQIYLHKLTRIHEIELELGMQQHLRWFSGRDGKATCHVYGCKGIHLDFLIYGITSVGTPLVVVLVFGLEFWPVLLLVFSILVTIAVSRKVCKNEKSIKQDFEGQHAVLER